MLIPEKYRERYDNLARAHPWMREMRDETRTVGDLIEERNHLIVERDYVRRGDYDFMVDALKAVCAERDEWKAKAEARSVKRAAAVKRLNHSWNACIRDTRQLFGSLVGGGAPTCAERNDYDALIDLLTDDDANDDLPPDSDVRATDADANDANAAQDTREKLEADLKTHLYEFGGYCFSSREGHTDNVDTFFDDFVFLLDRQAAITERELRGKIRTIRKQNKKHRKQISELTAERDELQAEIVSLMQKKQPYTFNPEAPIENIKTVCCYIDELTAERDEWKTKCETREVAYKQADAERKRYSEQIDELTAERDTLMTALKQSQEDCQMWHDQFDAENAAHMETRKELNACADVRDKAIAERDHLEAQVRQLEGDLKGARKSRDHWQRVASGHAAEIQRLKHNLEAERELARMWPRYSDGRPVRVGDEIGFEGCVRRVERIEFGSATFKLHAEHESRRAPFGTEIDYPPLTAKDGQPIEEGTLLYGEDGRAWLVESIAHGEKYPIEGSCDGEYKRLKPEWLTHEKPKDSLDDVVLMLRCCPGLDGRDCDVLADRIEKLAKEAGR